MSYSPFCPDFLRLCGMQTIFLKLSYVFGFGRILGYMGGTISCIFSVLVFFNSYVPNILVANQCDDFVFLFVQSTTKWSVLQQSSLRIILLYPIVFSNLEAFGFLIEVLRSARPGSKSNQIQ